MVSVGNTGELAAALAAMRADARVVLVLAPGAYGVTVDIGGSAEVALIGAGGPPVLTGDGARALEVYGDAIVYVGGVNVSNSEIVGNGLECSGRSTWLDDSQILGNQVGVAVSAGCSMHMRRSTIANNQAGGIDSTGGALAVINSAIGPNGDGFASIFGGLRLANTSVAMSYSSIVANVSMNSESASIACVGGETGFIRNSIAVGAGNSIDDCPGLVFSSNGVDDSALMGTNEDVGAALPAWFVGIGTSDLHLTPAGIKIFDGLAQWQPGDPLFDVDGESVSTGEPSFPGYDQP